MNEKGEIVKDLGGNIIVEKLNLYVKGYLISRIVVVCGDDYEKISKEYKNGALFDKKFLRKLNKKIYVKSDREQLEEVLKTNEKRKIMRETKMSSEEYNRIVLKIKDESEHSNDMIKVSLDSDISDNETFQENS